MTEYIVPLVLAALAFTIAAYLITDTIIHHD